MGKSKTILLAFVALILFGQHHLFAYSNVNLPPCQKKFNRICSLSNNYSFSQTSIDKINNILLRDNRSSNYSYYQDKYFLKLSLFRNVHKKNAKNVFNSIDDIIGVKKHMLSLNLYMEN